MWISKKNAFYLLMICGASMVFTFCRKVPVSGREQFNLIPESQIVQMSSQEYAQTIQQSRLSSNAEQVAQVKNVGARIQAAVEKYMADQGRSAELKGYNWEFNLIQNDTTVNAWCMPGGKVAFYTGIMPICQTEAGVAVVMGHEVSHAIARHGNERMSQGLAEQAGGVALDVLLSQKTAQTRQLFEQAYGVTAQYGLILPFSRKQESEADHLGLIFMAMAGYDPQQAIEFWKRMSALSAGKEPPEFSSTHPSDAHRVKALQDYLPEAMKYYKPQ